MLMFWILFLQMGHLESQVANFSLTEQSWQQHACPHGRKTVLTGLSKQILHSSLTWYLASSKDTSGPVFSALEVEAALGLLGTGLAAAAPILDMEFCRRRGVAAWEIDWIIKPAWTSKVSLNICSGVLTSAACPVTPGNIVLGFLKPALRGVKSTVLKTGTGLLLEVAPERLVSDALGIDLGPIVFRRSRCSPTAACAACLIRHAAQAATSTAILARCSCRRLLLNSGKIVSCLSMPKFLVVSTNLLTRSGLEPLSLALGSALYSLDFNSASVLVSSQDLKELMSPKKDVMASYFRERNS